jgi:hypothetical protein
VEADVSSFVATSTVCVRVSFQSVDWINSHGAMCWRGLPKFPPVHTNANIYSSLAKRGVGGNTGLRVILVEVYGAATTLNWAVINLKVTVKRCPEIARTKD